MQGVQTFSIPVFSQLLSLWFLIRVTACYGHHCPFSVRAKLLSFFASMFRSGLREIHVLHTWLWTQPTATFFVKFWPPSDALDFCIMMAWGFSFVQIAQGYQKCRFELTCFILNQLCCKCAFWHPLRGQRLGEAALPGPSLLQKRVCITNPTCIANKHDYYGQIASEHQVHLFTASETAATLKSQKIFTAQLSRLQYKVLWSQPMEDQFRRSDGEQSLRGKASGTALFTTLPCRAAIDTLDAQWIATGRLLHSVVSFGCLQIQIVVVYGLPSSRNNAAGLNSQLILEAVKACSKLALPYIIAGDFNVNPFSLDCGATLVHLGLKDLIVLSEMQLGKAMPPTCRDSTITDNAILSPELFRFVKDIWVSTDQYFDTHRPVFIDFAFPDHNLYNLHLKQPRSWIELDIDDALFPDAYQQAVDCLGQPDSIEEWGSVVECAVDVAFRQQQSNLGIGMQSVRGLPKHFRGRCKPLGLRKAHKQSLTPASRPGDYQPPGEIYDFATRKKVIHLRRVQSFLRRYQKNHHLMDCYVVDLLQEWGAILRNRSWGTSFHNWCIQQPELGPPGYPLPSYDFVHMLFQLAKFHTDATVCEQQMFWRQKRSLNQLWDGKHKGSSQAFARMKQSFRPPVSELKMTVSDEVHLTPDDGDTLTAFSGCPRQFCPYTLVKVNQSLCAIEKVDDFSLCLRPLSPIDLEQEAHQLQQQCVIHEPAAIFASLTEFWKQFWHHPETSEAQEPSTFLRELLQSFPPLNFQDIRGDDPELWIQAIRTIKATTARGVDNISAAELKQLPTQAIHDLCRIMSSYSEGFPKWFAVAKTYLVPKVDGIPCAEEIRPISVLPQLYRLWSRVVCAQLFQQLARQIPKQVTGMLQNRGPMDSAYDWQYWLEYNQHHDIQASGLSLDLLKCFNTIDQDGALLLLQTLGFPDHILQQWFSTIKQLSRIWILGPYASSPQDCSRGFPEGDSFSVVVMICIGHVWTTAVQRISSQIKSSAYADNWGWATVQPRLHEPIIDLTTRFVASLGMIIDWKKCWMWGRSKQHLTILRQALSSVVSPTLVNAVSSAQDLGCSMTYHGPPRLGKLSKRIHKSSRRLEQLGKLQYDLKIKTLLVRGGVFSSFFWGMELVPLGSQHLQTLRVQTSNALLGNSVSRNSAIAIAFTPGLLDPAVALTIRVIAAARRFLFRSDEQVRSSFLSRLACHTGIHHDCRGPVGVLKYYLLKFGWQVTRTGQLLVTAFVQLHLLTSSLRSIQDWLTWTWQQDVIQRFSLRKGHSFCPPVSIPDTVAVIKTFELPQQMHLLEEIAGGFQTQHQKSVWDPECDDKCRFCPFVDSRFHRVFECAAVGHLRQPYQRVLDKYLELDSNIQELPVILQQPQEEFVRMCHFQHPEAIIDNSLRDKIQRLTAIAPVTFYTDGSCQHPHQPTSRYAAYAIVFDASVDDNHKRDLARQYQLSGLVPSTLQVIAVARTTGTQTIFRSELMAILKVCEWFDNTIIYSDSSSALSAIARCQQSCCGSMLGADTESDIMQRFWEPLRSRNRAFVKIKAHTDPMQCQDLLQCYHLLGNQVADMAAVNCAKYHSPTFVAEAEELHQHIVEQSDMLKQLYQMQLEVSKYKAQLAASLDSETRHKPQSVEPPSRDFLKEACTWNVETVWVAPPMAVNNLQYCAWGPFLARSLLDWMGAIQWPVESALPDNVGVTWLELVASFSQWLGFLFPVKRRGKGSVFYLQPIENFSDAALYCVQWSEMAKWFAIFVDQCTSLCSEPFWPRLPRGLVRSLYMLGAATHSSGVRLRPSLPGQAELMPIISEHVRHHQGQAYSAIPDIPLRASDDFGTVKLELKGTWDDKSKRAHFGSLEIRRWKKQPQQQLVFR